MLPDPSQPDKTPQEQAPPAAESPQEAPTEQAPSQSHSIDTTLREAHAGDGPDERVAALIQSDAPPEQLAKGVEAQEPADAADVLEDLGTTETTEVLHAMADEAAAQTLVHMDPAFSSAILISEPPDQIAAYLQKIDTDDAADILQSLPKDLADAVFRALPRRLAASLGKLVLYDPETAGGLMRTNIVRLRTTMTVADAIERIRFRKEDEELFYLYCTDEDGTIKGVVNLRSLVLASQEQRIKDIMSREVDVLPVDLDREDVARAFDRYDFVALPVVDTNNRILGVVDIDDVIDTIRAEHTEDALKQVGAGAHESVYARPSEKLRARMPWLIVNLAAAGCAAVVVKLFDNLFQSLAFLAVVMPVIANQAGNAGSQSMAVMLRGIVLGEVRHDRVLTLFIRESLYGLLAGIGIGLLAFATIAGLGAAGVDGVSWRIGIVAGISMAGAVAVACAIGSLIPVTLVRLKIDPATASSIFLLWLTDMLSFAAFSGLAYLTQGWLLS